MLITQRKFGIFKIVNVYFPEEPGTADIPDFDVVTYYTYKNWGDIKRFDRINYFTTTIDLSQDIGEIWSKIKRQHKRHIRRAQNDGTNITVSNNFEEFHKIYKRFLKLKNYTNLFGLNILSSKFMQKFGILFIAENQGEILGGNLYYYDENNAVTISTAYQQFGDSIEKNKQISDANCYIHWEAIQYFKNLNVINYDLGGLHSNDIHINHQMHGLDYFKRSFGGEVIPQYAYRKFNSRFYKLLFHSWNSWNFLLTRA
jgi:lipid II:glycine glycyltransferase (peptidoglycan interpeptide bridge formation enzyme)